MPVIKINDLDLYYETVGDKSPLLMIAGLASDSQSWAPVVPQLSPHFQLIMPDNRATGRTAPIEAETGIELMAGDCMALLDTMGLERIKILGHSMGGMVAMNIAARWPDRVDQLVIAASGPHHSARRVSLIDTLVSLGEAGTSDELWFKSLFHWLFAPAFFSDAAAVDNAITMSAAYPHRQPIAAMRRQADAIAQYIPGEVTANIIAPTLALLGEKDLLFPPVEAAESLKAIRKVEIKVVPEAGHSVHWDAPTAFAERVLAFLNH